MVAVATISVNVLSTAVAIERLSVKLLTIADAVATSCVIC